MPFAQLKKISQLISLVCILLVACVFAASVVTPLETPDIKPTRLAEAKTDGKADTSPSLSIEDFGNTLAFQLQRPLVDPPKQPEAGKSEEKKSTPKPIKVAAKLVGTIVDDDPEKSVAWLKPDRNSSSLLMVQQGDRIKELPQQPLVKQVLKTKVVFRINNQDIEMMIEQ